MLIKKMACPRGIEPLIMASETTGLPINLWTYFNFLYQLFIITLINKIINKKILTSSFLCD